MHFFICTNNLILSVELLILVIVGCKKIKIRPSTRINFCRWYTELHVNYKYHQITLHVVIYLLNVLGIQFSNLGCSYIFWFIDSVLKLLEARLIVVETQPS
jgi:hypothetical protein